MANFTEGLDKLAFCGENQLPVAVVNTKHGELMFTMYGETTEFRVRTLFTKEPETIAWIDTFQPGEVFWDIGANIGIYGLYAAKRGLTVHMFEPSPVNYWLLTRNVAINNLENVTTYPFAFSDGSGLFFCEPNISPGSANNQLLVTGKKTCIQSYTIDDLLNHGGLEIPNHIKLDVDGIELRILLGGEGTLGHERVRSVMCEVTEGDGQETDLIVEFLAKQGFGAPVTRHPPYFDDYYYAPVFNYLFKK